MKLICSMMQIYNLNDCCFLGKYYLLEMCVIQPQPDSAEGREMAWQGGKGEDNNIYPARWRRSQVSYPWARGKGPETGASSLARRPQSKRSAEKKEHPKRVYCTINSILCRCKVRVTQQSTLIPESGDRGSNPRNHSSTPSPAFFRIRFMILAIPHDETSLHVHAYVSTAKTKILFVQSGKHLQTASNNFPASCCELWWHVPHNEGQQWWPTSCILEPPEREGGQCDDPPVAHDKFLTGRDNSVMTHPLLTTSFWQGGTTLWWPTRSSPKYGGTPVW